MARPRRTSAAAVGHATSPRSACRRSPSSCRCWSPALNARPTEPRGPTAVTPLVHDGGMNTSRTADQLSLFPAAEQRPRAVPPRRGHPAPWPAPRRPHPRPAGGPLPVEGRRPGRPIRAPRRPPSRSGDGVSGGCSLAITAASSDGIDGPYWRAVHALAPARLAEGEQDHLVVGVGLALEAHRAVDRDRSPGRHRGPLSLHRSSPSLVANQLPGVALGLQRGDRLRQRGHRVAVHVGDPTGVTLPPGRGPCAASQNDTSGSRGRIASDDVVTPLSKYSWIRPGTTSARAVDDELVDDRVGDRRQSAPDGRPPPRRPTSAAAPRRDRANGGTRRTPAR